MQRTKLLLIVDDNVDNLKVLSSLLKREYRIKVTTEGCEALRLAEGEPPPDLILLDVMMPEMDGYTVCERLKFNPQTRDIPVIFLTAKSQMEDETRGFQVGAVDYLTKPINPPVLWARVKAQLALAAQLKQTRYDLGEAIDHLTSLTGERNLIETQRQRLHDQQQALLTIARTALRDLPLENYLGITLEVLEAIPWLKVEARGVLFLVNRNGDLVMVAQRGLNEAQRAACAKVAVGVCACGQSCALKAPQRVPSLQNPPRHCRLSSANDTGCYALPLLEEQRILTTYQFLIDEQRR